jgi:hypothetical protein
MSRTAVRWAPLVLQIVLWFLVGALLAVSVLSLIDA